MPDLKHSCGLNFELLLNAFLVAGPEFCWLAKNLKIYAKNEIKI